MSLRASLYRELFQHLTAERHGSRPSAASATDLPRPLSRGLVFLYSLLRNETLASITPEVADSVADAVSHWFTGVWNDLVDGRDREEEPHALELPVAELHRRYPAGKVVWDRVERQRRFAVGPAAHRAIEALVQETIQAITVDERRHSEERAIRLVAAPLADRLNETIPELAEADRQATAVFGRPGDWDVFDDGWRSINWEIFEAPARDLRRSPDTTRLVELLTRGIAPEEARQVWSQIPVAHERTIESDEGYSHVVGLRGGSSVILARPDELALLASPETEDLFARKLAESGVLHLETDRPYRRSHVQTSLEWHQIPVATRPGPLYVCFDTSGSMRGLPDRVNRQLALAFVSSAVLHRRELHLVAVRDRLRLVSVPAAGGSAHPTVETGSMFTAGAPPRIDEQVIRALQVFLISSSTAGADVTPALDWAVEQVPTGGAVADVVVVSDMRFPRVGPPQRTALLDLQRHGAVRVHAVTIGSKPMDDPMNTFDFRWHFNTAPAEPLDTGNDPVRIGFRGDTSTLMS